MSYVFVLLIGAVAGRVAGQFLKGSDVPVLLDFGAGAAGAAVLVVLSRAFGPAAAAGLAMSVLVSILGAVAGLYGMRQFMKEEPLPVSRRRRRY